MLLVLTINPFFLFFVFEYYLQLVVIDIKVGDLVIWITCKDYIKNVVYIKAIRYPSPPSIQTVNRLIHYTYSLTPTFSNAMFLLHTIHLQDDAPLEGQRQVAAQCLGDSILYPDKEGLRVAESSDRVEPLMICS